MIAGINYPWTVIGGKPNYGCDFGRNIWDSHTGVSTHLDDVRADFARMAAMGYEVARWFVFTDGRGGVRWARPGRYYWPRGGAIAAGAAIGFVTAATAAAWAGAAPAPGMCWYYTGPSRTEGFWDYCQ